MNRLQMTWVFFMALSLAIDVVKHGRPREPYDLRISVVATAIAAVVWYWAGLWDACPK